MQYYIAGELFEACIWCGCRGIDKVEEREAHHMVRAARDIVGGDGERSQLF